MNYQLHHFHLICSDLEQMESFFIDALGAELLERKKFGGADGARLDLAGTPIYLRVAKEDEKMIDDPPGKRFGYDHLGLSVGDIQAAYQDLSARGFHFTVPPQKVDQAYLAFFQGPDNIIIELYQTIEA